MRDKLTSKNGMRLAIVGGVVLLGLIGFLLQQVNQNKNTPDLDSGRYYDSNSGQTISDPKGKTPDTFGSSKGQPIYLGLGELVESGLSITQMESLKIAFQAYFTQSKQTIKEVSINTGSIAHKPRQSFTDDPFILNFNVKLNRKKDYKASVDHTNDNVIRLFLYNSTTNAQIYDSGLVSANAGE